MRCNNCGWMNAENEQRCIKCNTVLSAGNTTTDTRNNTAAKFAGTLPGAQASAPTTGGDVPGPQMNNSGDSKEPEQEANTLLTCPWPDCGYIYPGQASVCPRCQRPFVAGKTAAPIPETIQPAAAKFAGTIDPYRNTNIPGKHSCQLQMVDTAGNSNDAGQLRCFTFEHAPVALNRDNLDPGNKHITGKVQAMLWYENGQWFLEDKSELQTTFFLIREKTALKAGDIIVMGDRKFIFNPVGEKESG